VDALVEHIDLDDLKAALADEAEALAGELFGQPISRSKHELRFGSRGSTAVTLSGPHRGSFRSWEEDRGGSMLDAIMFATGCSFHRAVEYGQAYLGIDGATPAPIRRRPVNVDKRIDKEAGERKIEARRVWNEAGPIESTPGEVYLQSRAIRPEEWPAAVRWHRDGYLAFASTVKSSVTQIQRVYITVQGVAKTREDGRKLKFSLGPGEGGSVRFDGKIDGPLCLAEGPETGLSIWDATGYETWVSLGGIRANLSEVPIDRHIYVCLDDDAKYAPSKKGIRDKIKAWRKEGRTVLIFLPFDMSRRDKSDFNDALQEYGPEYIRDRLSPSINSYSESQTSLADARKQLEAETKAAIRELTGWNGEGDAPVQCLKVGLGLGKTEEAIKGMIRHVRDAEDGRGVYSVPTHKLSTELEGRVRNLIKDLGAGGIRVETWRGREADNPDKPDQMMCQNIDAVREVQSVSGDVQSGVCRHEQEDGAVHKCAFFDDCAYQDQKQKRADIWIVAHHTLFTEKPDAISHPDLLVIDEAFHSAGLRGIGHLTVVSEDQIEAGIWHASGQAAKTADLNSTLKPIRDKLAPALQSHETGPLQRETLISAGLTPEECRTASKIEWERQISVKVFPGMPDDLRRQSLQAAAINKEIPRMARLWKLSAAFIEGSAELSGHLSMAMIDDKKAGTSYRAVQMRWIDEIREGWKAPTLHIDATMRMELVRAYFANAELRAEISAAAPHQTVTQIYDKTFSAASLKHDPPKMDKLWTRIRSTVTQEGGNWLVVVQKDIEDYIRANYVIPQFIEIAHHNGIAGIDRWREVDGLIVVGRTQPPPQAVAQITGAMTGEYIPALEGDGWYPATTTTIRAKDGKSITVETDIHPHETAEAIRASICDDQSLQITGRARGANRTAIDPVKIIVFGNIPVIEPDQLEEYRHPTVDDYMLAEGVWLENAEDAVRVTPALKSAAAVRKSKSRDTIQSVTFSYKDILIGKCHSLELVTYKKAGARQKRHVLVYDTRVISDIKAWLADHFGELVEFAIERPSTASMPIIFPEYLGGVMPLHVRQYVTETLRDSSLIQQELAEIIGLSHPQLSDALHGRCGLTVDIVTRLRHFLTGHSVLQ